MKGFFNKYETADAKTKPLDSIAAILSTLKVVDLSIIWFIVSTKAFFYLLLKL